MQDYNSNEIADPGHYEFLLQTTEIEKLGPPHKSKCTNENSIGDKHHSRYSYNGCMDRCAAMKMKKRCGIVNYFFRELVSAEDELALKPNTTAVECLRKLLIEYSDTNAFLIDCGCQQPCTQRVYEVTRKRVGDLVGPFYWRLKIRFKNKMVNVIREHTLYTAQELISQVGGSCGLFLGMSILSLIEIIFHAVISIVKVFF